MDETENIAAHRDPEPGNKHDSLERVIREGFERVARSIDRLASLLPQPSSGAVRARLSIKERTPMSSAQITVDDANKLIQLEFADDHGDPTGPPDGVVATFTGDNDAVATFADAIPGTDPTTNVATVDAPTTPVAEGTVNISVALTAADGSELFEADGTTPFPQPDPFTLTIVAGPAASGQMSLATS